VFGHVVRRQNDDAVSAGPPGGHAPVVIGGSDHPAVAVFDPARSGGEVAVVSPGDDVVAHADHLSSGNRQAVFGDFSGGDAVGAGTAVQLGHGGGVGGDHEARRGGVDVVLPCRVDGVEQLLAGNESFSGSAD
jgi:hypothetical protein